MPAAAHHQHTLPPRAGRSGYLLWVLLAVALIGLLWWFTLAHDKASAAEAQRGAIKEAGAAAQAYEQYVTRSVAQMDQVSMQLAQSWQASGGRLQLDSLTRAGMFLDSAFHAVQIFGADGRMLSATHGTRAAPAAPCFDYHRNNNSSSLSIVAPGPRAPVQDVVLFCRRLELADDAFAGVVVVTVPAHYFTSFYMPSALGKHGVVATMGADSALRLEQRHTATVGDYKSLFPSDATLWAAPSGAAVLQGRYAFADGQARILAWRHSAVYPVVALVAVSLAEALAPAQQQQQTRRQLAAIASVLLALLAILASGLTRRASQRTDAQDEIRSAYRTATENANDGFYLATALRDGHGCIVDFEITDCNERGAYFYGMSRASLVGRRISTVTEGDFGAALMAAYSTAMATGFYEDERELPDDARLNIKWVHRRIVRVGNGLAITLRDIGERRTHLVELERLANADLLTSLPNRHWLLRYLPDAIEKARQQRTQVAVMFIDLDEFKSVNDAHGHGIGDEVLKAACARIRKLLRPDDRIARFGGDEFIVVLERADSAAGVGQIAARIVGAFDDVFKIGSERLHIGASVGISLYPRDGGDAAALLKQSDIAMYAGKSEGKGQYRFFEPALAQRLQQRMQLKHSLAEAISLDQFVLHYQPRVDAASGATCSMEALIRWIHPQHGMIAPLDFIPLAESSGMIVRIGDMVMEKACRQIACWRDAGVPLVPVSINVSPKQFEHGAVHQHLERCMLRHGVPAALLEIEITESAMLGERSAVMAELAALRKLGIRLHVDDFGTGYSSLAQLQKLKLDVLKVDRAFTAELGVSREGRVFFQAIVSMAQALGMTVVAEGVETQAQLDILRELQCNEVQGYYLSRPLAAESIPALLARASLFPRPAAAINPC